ncbi:PhzF family phenazine biosynthesis protein [Dyella sp. KULCS107]|uniref:PhzF family phenazine biosynthesis protein n=1 Tax=Dyella sp. KULCS107 TaxID=3422216 RepID=UPI003D6E9127
MPTRRFMQLDVFADRPLRGNPLAVVIDAEGIDSATMQAFARWTNLSETTFLLSPTTPQADYRVRIFTPRQELPFAGHPSVGSAYAAIEAGLVEAGKRGLVQECAAGLLPVRVEGDGAARVIHVQAPPARIAPIDAGLRSRLAAALPATLDEADMARVDNGPHWLLCDLQHANAVRALAPDLAAIAALCEHNALVGVSVFGAETDGTAAMAVRAFCPGDGIPEDPVTGSANAAIMAVLGARGDARYGLHHRASQGREVGRDGLVEVARDAATGAITIGGACALTVRGALVI